MRVLTTDHTDFTDGIAVDPAAKSSVVSVKSVVGFIWLSSDKKCVRVVAKNVGLTWHCEERAGRRGGRARVLGRENAIKDAVHDASLNSFSAGITCPMSGKC